MKKRVKKAAITLLAVMSAVFFLGFGIRTTAEAGFGNFNDYDSGGSDWGGSDWGGGSDWSYDSGSDYGYSSGSGTDLPFPVLVIIIILFIVISTRGNKMSGKRSGSSTSQRTTTRTQEQQFKLLPNRTDEISKIIKEEDPLFTAPDFLSFARQVYMDIQMAWEYRDLEPVRAVLHQNLYQQTHQQIQKKIKDGIINHLERISINTAHLTSYRRDAQYEYLTIYLAASMIDYQVKEATGEIILGNKTTRWNMYYKMTFMRSRGAKSSSANDKDRGFVCPNCGAPLTGTSFGKCEYCDSVVTTGKYSWVLSGFGVIKNDTVDEGISI